MILINPLNKIKKLTQKVNSYEPEMEKLTDEQLRNKTDEFKTRLQSETLDGLLPEAFAVVREASKRMLGKRHYDVQVMAAIALHQGKIAQQYTGEGKTLTATMPVYLNALTGKGVHVVTVNDYLAERDMLEMGKIYKFLGLTVGWIYPKMDHDEKRMVYKCDVVYGTNKEFGFDYLRDNMMAKIEKTYQRELNYAIIDEVDSILIDEARTPLIISNEGMESTDIYKQADACVRTLIRGEDAKDSTKLESIMESFENKELTPEEIEKKGDYTVNERDGTIVLTDRGVSKIEKFFNIENFGSIEHTNLSHHINQALRAHNLMHKDKNYIVKNGEVLIVDDFTGRILDGRRYSDGLHQAIEAKEGVEVQKENRTMATISLQNYFRLYKKIAGMTGTAATEKTEFKDIYKLEVVVIPPNKPIIRKDNPDIIYQTMDAKFNAIAKDIAHRHSLGQPVLVGTPTIEQSELLSHVLSQNKIPHHLLNAKNNEREASIVAQAGKFGAVTIATNMAGRGTDILLGGNPEFMAKKELESMEYTEEDIQAAMSLLPPTTEEEAQLKQLYTDILTQKKAECDAESEKVKAVGGLHVIGTAKHEARRIDNQLRGRAGRQGDPGSSQFYISLEDELVKMFAGDKLKSVIAMLNLPEDTPIHNPQISKMVETSQKRFELKNFESRKMTLEYDDINNEQRKIIYGLRREILEGKDMNKTIDDMITYQVNSFVQKYIYDKNPAPEQIAELNAKIKDYFRTEENYLTQGMSKKEIEEKLLSVFFGKYNGVKEELERKNGNLADLQRFILLRMIDRRWISYITALQNLRDSVSLVSYGGEKPVDMYKREAASMFNDLIATIKETTVRGLLTVVITKSEPTPEPPTLGNLMKPQIIKTAQSPLQEMQKTMGRAPLNTIPKG